MLMPSFQVWWSPCPSRECPEEEEIDIVVDQCLDHCLLLEQNPKIEVVPPPTFAPILPPSDVGEQDDLELFINKKINRKNKTFDVLSSVSSSTTESYLDSEWCLHWEVTVPNFI